MARFVVMQPGPGMRGAPAADARIVRDNFAILGFLLPPIYLLWHRLWIEAAIVVAASLALTALGELGGYAFAGSALSILLGLFVGLEGAAMRLAAMRRRGWHEWGVIDAAGPTDAEARYAIALDGSEPSVEPYLSPMFVPGARASGPALGLLNYPGRG